MLNFSYAFLKFSAIFEIYILLLHTTSQKMFKFNFQPNTSCHLTS